MTTRLKITIAIFGVTLAGASVYFLTRSKGSGLLAYVPNDASMVIRFNLPKIAKFYAENKDEISKMTIWKKATEASNNSLDRAIQGIVKNPEASGIDFSLDCMLFVHKAQRGENTGMLLRLKNASDFAKYIKNNTPAGSISGNENGVEYAEFGTGLFISWNNEVALITEQMAEPKAYFAAILNKSNPSAKGNLLLSKVEDGEGYAILVMGIDQFFTGKNAPIESKEFHNPFPPGTAIMCSLNMVPGEISADIHMIANNQKDLDKLGFFKESSKLKQYNQSIFPSGNPLFASALGIDIEKFLDFSELINPKYKETRNDPTIKGIIQSLSGDFVFGFATKPEVIASQIKAIEDHNYDSYPTEPAYSFLVHIGTKNQSIFKSKISEIATPENGIYTLFGGFFQMYLLEYEDHFLATFDKTILEKTIANGNKIKKPDSSFNIPSECLNAPFAMIMNNNNFLGTGFYSSLQINPKFSKYFNGNYFIFKKEDKIIGKFKFKDTKSHPLMAYLHMANLSYEEAEMNKTKVKGFYPRLD